LTDSIAVVREVFEAFAARDAERLLTLLDPEVEFYGVTNERAGHVEPYRGHAGMREYFRDVARVWDELRLRPDDYRDLGDSVLVTGRVYARNRSRSLAGTAGWVWRLRDGKVVSGRAYESAAEAIAAVGEK
jgi:ketosteroid isomerase-like protein